MKSFYSILSAVTCTIIMLNVATGCNPAANEDTSISVSKTELSFQENGGGYELVTIDTDFEWDVVVSDAEWIVTEKINFATLKVTVKENGLETYMREGIITIVPEKGEPQEITVRQVAGYTISGAWQALGNSFSSDLEKWSIGNDFVKSGMMVIYTFDLENNICRMSVGDGNPDNDVEQEVDIVSYDTEKRTFTISDTRSEMKYTIYKIDNEVFEFYAWSEMDGKYLKMDCKRYN